MSSSRIIQISHFIKHRVQCKKNIFIFIFIFLTLHIFYFYFFSEPITISSSFYAESTEFTSPLYYIVRICCFRLLLEFLITFPLFVGYPWDRRYYSFSGCIQLFLLRRSLSRLLSR